MILKNILLLLLILLVVCQNEYDIKQSQQFQKYSVLTYCSKQLIMDWTAKICTKAQKLVNIEYFENNATSILGFAGYSQSLDKIVVVFRGTLDVKNWVQDFTFKQVLYSRCKNCQVHQGFYLSYISIAQQLYKAIERIQFFHPNAKILVTGPSLGGALATIAAIELNLKYQSVAQLHTFGGPRTGNLQFAMFVQSRVSRLFRVVHNRDIVPHLPLIKQNYHQPATQIFFDELMSKYKVCNDSGEDSTCSDSFSPNYTIADHLTYWTKLNITEIC